MQSVLMTVLIFETIVYGLSIFVIHRVADYPGWLAAVLGGSVALLALIAAATLRRGTFGYAVGWVTQIAAVGLGFAHPSIWIVAGIFVGLWVLGIILGRRLEAGAQGAS